MKNFLRWLAFPVVIIASFGLGVLAATLLPETTPLAPPTVEATAKPDPVVLNGARLEELINKERTNAGLSELAHSDLLQKSACLKLTHMTAFQYWDHVAPDGTIPWDFIKFVGYRYLGAGENLARGQTTEKDAVTDWMSSPEHKKNILGSYNETGICTKTVLFKDREQTLTVQHFGLR